MNKTVFLIAALLIAGAGGTFIFLKPNPKKQVEHALLCLKKGDSAAAEGALRSLSNASTGYPEAFYFGCLEQSRGCFDTSDRFFKIAFQEASRGYDVRVLSEITLAKAFNAYCDQRDPDFYASLEAASTFSTNDSALKFFEGLAKYMQKDYAEALRLWNSYSPDSLSEWMALSLEKIFSKAWKKLHVAHCLIEEGDLFAGREILEKEDRQLDLNNQGLRQLTTLFLGLTYLKEARQIPLDRRDSYYKLARFYFERAHVGCSKQDAFFREKQRIAAHVEEEAKGLLLVDFDEGKRKWGFDFIHLLQDWKAAQSIEVLSDALAKMILRQKGSACIQLCQTTRHEFLGTFFHTRLTERILSELSQALKAGETENLIELWNLVEAIAPNPKAAAKQIATLTADEILETIKKDDIRLSRTCCFIAFWEKLGRSPHEREILARDLVIHAKLFWHNDKQEKKGLRLMEIALKLSGKSPYIEKDISNFLTRLYSQAESSNMIRRLSIIYDAMESFDISRQELVSKKTLANHLADAEYLYESHNYPAAKIHASWVLKLDPHNEGARRLAGLSAFNLGEYHKALCHLKHLQNLDEAAHRALMLSQAFSSQEQGRHLCQIDASDSFDQDGE